MPDALPSGWRYRTIADLAADVPNAIVDGPFGSNLKISDYVDVGVPVLQGGNITGDTFRLIGLRFVTHRKASELSRSMVRVGDVLVVKIGSVGYSAIVDSLGDFNEALIPANLLKATFNSRDASFVYVHKWLTSRAGRQSLLDAASQTAQPALTLGRFRKIQLPLPPLSEQQQIAAILDTIDEAIRKTEQSIAKLKQVKQGLLHDLLTRGIDDNGELRDSERRPQQFKDSPLGRIPRGWEVCHLGSIIDEIQQGWSPDCASVPATPGEWGVLKTTAVQRGGYSSEANKALPRHLAPRPGIEVNEGDVLMTRAGPASRVGVVCYVERTQGRLMLSDKLYRLVPSAVLHPHFLSLGLSGEVSQRHLSSMKAGLAETQENISHAIVRALRFLLPPLEEQRRICAQVVIWNKRETIEGLLLEKLRLTKTGLLDDLLTGRVRVTKLLENAAE